MTPPRGRPAFAISTTSSPLVRLIQYARAAEDAAVAGVDLDLTGPRLRRRLLGASVDVAPATVVNLWLPGAIDRMARLLDEAPADCQSFVVEESRDGERGGRAQLAAAIALRERTPADARISLAFRPRNLEGGRAHLSAASFLRNLAEEWDLDLALDLTGAIDWLWEAEAAVFRVMPRLRLIRVTSPMPSLDAHVRARLTKRTLAACADAGFTGLISVAVPLPFWQWRNDAALADALRDATNRISARYGLSPARTASRVSQRR